MIVSSLKKSILQQAFQGKLSNRLSGDTDINYMITKLKEKKEKNIRNKKYKKTPIGLEIKPEDIKYDIPPTWSWIRFIDICSVMTCGYASTPQYVEDGMPFLSAKNIKPYEFRPQEYKKISYELYDKLTTNCKPEKNDILLTRVGAGIGESAIIDVEMDFAIYVSLTLIKLVDYDLINNKYILYWLNSPYGLSTSLRNITGKESSQGNLNVDNVRNFMIPLPPIEEQKRIVDKIDYIFEKLDQIEPLENELNILKNNLPNEMSKSILNSAYTGNLLEGITNYDEWNVSNILKIVDVCTGNSISESIKKNKYSDLKNGYNYIATKDLGFDHIFNYDNGIKIPFDEEGFKHANKNDILLCIEGGSAGKKIGILSEKVCFGNKLCKFSIKSDEIDSKYLYYYLQSPIFLNNFYENLSGIIGGVSINKIKQLEIKYPSLEDQKKLVEKIEQLLPLCDDIEKLINN